jgi:hypothetical protein
MRNYCTLFDKNYLYRGLALYESLIRNSSVDFTFYVLPMDEETKVFLKKNPSENLKVIDYGSFEDCELRAAKEDRGRAEYCWTCTPSLILYCIEKYTLGDCTYLDADIYFYGDPENLFSEVEEKSILLTRHNFSIGQDQEKTSGTYCVQFMYFRNDNDGMTALRWWRNACLEFCGLDPQNGSCGDQGYLNDWTERFEGVHVLDHRGGGVAPWNIEDYELGMKSGELVIRNFSNTPIIFYHFHALKLRGATFIPTGPRYKLSQFDLGAIYIPYINNLLTLKEGASLQEKEWGDDRSLNESVVTSCKGIVKRLVLDNYNYNQSLSDREDICCRVCGNRHVKVVNPFLYDDRYAYPNIFTMNYCKRCGHHFLNDNFIGDDLMYLYSNYYPRSNFSLDDYTPIRF